MPSLTHGFAQRHAETEKSLVCISNQVSFESQRDSTVQPKVATRELPWGQIKNIRNPNAGCIFVSPFRRTRARIQLLQSCFLFLTVTQGSSFVATLG
jgi:hypothetical protein